MAQLALFEASPAVFADDERGRIEYTPGWVPADLAREWFEALRDTVVWAVQRRMMYEREVDVPRLTAHFDLVPASETENETPENETPENRDVPPSIEAAVGRIRVETGVPFNSVGLNRYRDGNDSVAPHNDHLDTIVRGHPIALVSLGATRRMVVRAKAAPRRVLNLDLEPGSLLLMSYATQVHYTHGIPKTLEPVGERISLAFRVRVEDEPREEQARRRQYRRQQYT